MEKRKVLTMLFPTLSMTIITITSFSNMLNFNAIDFKGIFILSLILLFPLLFLMQGIICAISNINVFLSLGVSILNFIILTMVYLNDSALIYVLIYVTFGVIGYIITKYIVKSKASKNNY
ncbi:hypothetical protein CLPUN_29510 [Clostridium puniceum]|uniref:Uncharacterized protein n=1 Tax=Clostridium puniceum TaxID=29367 RepID=A0A1S8TE70_9CLOT|nr:hypothetical protein [Clostridium puniceum]OOM75914.1 hypothetical protein CLPUN_29510 [Clostridium puniceum]